VEKIALIPAFCFPLSRWTQGRAGVRILPMNWCFEPLNLLNQRLPAGVRSVAAFPFGAFRLFGLPAGEIGFGCLRMHCLVTPLGRCSHWGRLSFD
jgi:hypothetical protein